MSMASEHQGLGVFDNNPPLEYRLFLLLRHLRGTIQSAPDQVL